MSWYKQAKSFWETVKQYDSVRDCASATDVHYSTLYRWMARHDGKITLSSSSHEMTPEGILAEHGLDAETYVYGVRAGRRETQAGVLSSITVQARRKPSKDDLWVVRPDGWVKPRIARKTPLRASILHVIRGDRHDPYKDEGLHSCFLQWLAHNTPDYGWSLGDDMDMPKPSRHRAALGKRFRASPKECMNACYNSWRDDIHASPLTEWTTMPGNHDLRVEIAVRGLYPDLADIPCKAMDERPWYDLEVQLRFDELGVTYVREDHEYFASKIELADGLMLEHGVACGAHGGALKESMSLQCSNMQGHDHKQTMSQDVKYDAKNIRHVYRRVSVGAMCIPDLGYTDRPDAQQGFATAIVRKNGTYHLELSYYDSKRKELYWRDQVFAS